MTTVRTKGISPKLIAPVVAALSAFAQAKIHDQATAALVIALIGAGGLFLSSPGEVEVVEDITPDDFEPTPEDVDEVAGPQVVQPSQMADLVADEPDPIGIPPDDRPTTVIPPS